MKSKTAQQRFDDIEAIIAKITPQRTALIALSKQLAAASNLTHEKVLNAVFSRNFTASHMKDWWGERREGILRRFQEEDAYNAVAAKLTAEERKLLGIREPVSRRPKKKPAKKAGTDYSHQYRFTQQ
jgi:hypothetical protein